MSRPERHVDDITDMRRSCQLRENTSARRPLGSSSRLLKVPNKCTLKRKRLLTVFLCFASLNCNKPKNHKTEGALIPGSSYQIAFFKF